MPAAGGQPLENARLRRRRIEMEGLRIVLAGEVDDFALRHEINIRAETLASGDIFKIAGRHCGGRKGETFNAQRPTSNVSMKSAQTRLSPFGRWKLNVECWTFPPKEIGARGES